MLTELEPKASQASSLHAEQFPLSTLENFDYVVSEPWTIGLRKTHPAELKRRVIAAGVSLFLRNKSVDSTIKTYLKDRDFIDDSINRLDIRIEEVISVDLERLEQKIESESARADDKVGRLLSEWTFARTPFALKFFISCAHKGALYEPISIARMILEQLAWALAVRPAVDADVVQKTSAQSVIAELKKVNPRAGQLYGWMSSHSHWAYDAHIKSMIHEPKFGLILASSEYKVVNFALSLVMAKMIVKSFLYSTSTIQDWNTFELSKNADGLLNEIALMLKDHEDIKFLQSVSKF